MQHKMLFFYCGFSVEGYYFCFIMIFDHAGGDTGQLFILLSCPWKLILTDNFIYQENNKKSL